MSSAPPPRWANVEGPPKRISNVAAARPLASAVNPGDFYLATDTGSLQVAAGDAWSSLMANSVDVRQYGDLGTAATAAAAIDAALAAAEPVGGTVLLPAQAFSTTGDHEIPKGVRVVGHGPGATVITHTGNNACFHCAPNDYVDTAMVVGVKIKGNTGAAARGVRHGDTWGFRLDDVVIEDYTAGIGWEFYNDAGWTEGTECFGVRIRNCAVSVGFTRSADSTWDSFGYTRLDGLSMNVPASGVGIRFGHTLLEENHYFYHCLIRANVWLASNSAAMAFVADTNGEYNVLQVTGEKESGASSTTTWGATAPAKWEFSGLVRVASDDTGYQSNTAPGLAVAQDSHSQVAIFRAASGHDGGTPLVRFESNNGTATSSVYEWGGIVATYLGVGEGLDSSEPAFILSGSGSPEGAVTGRVGHLYLRRDGGSGTTLYVKESGNNTNTGWVAK